MTHHNHHLKRLKHATHSTDHRLSVPDNEAMRESIQNFSITHSQHSKSVIDFTYFYLYFD